MQNDKKNNGLRIKELIETLGMSQRAFCNAIDSDYANMNCIINGKRNAGGGIISKIVQTFPNVSRKWLQYGEGEMFLTSTNTINGNIQGRNIISMGGNITNTTSPITTEEAGDVEEPEELEEIPVVPRSIYTEPNVNILEYVQNNEVQMSPRIHQLSQYDLCYMVVNDEMSPYICAGDRIYLWAYPEGKERKIIDGRVYSVDTKLNGVLTRQLYKTDKGFLAKSFNPRYADEVLEWEDIYRVYRIVGVLRMDE